MLTLTGSNTYSGVTTIGAGTLQVGNGAPIGSSSSVLDNGNLVFNHNDAATFSLVVSGVGGLTQTGTGILTLTAGNTYTGPTTISSGTLQVGGGGGGASIGGISNVLDNASLVFNHNDSQTIAGAIGGSGNLTQTGTGILTLTANNTYTGPTTVSAGTLQVGNGGSGASIGGTSIVLDNASLVFNPGDAATLSAVVSGSGRLTQAGTGLLKLTASNIYTGGTTISAGTLSVAADDNLGTGGLVFGGGGAGVLEILGSGTFSSAKALALNQAGTLQQDDTAAATWSGMISGSGALIKAGAGTLVLSDSDNAFSGGTFVAAGTLLLTNGGAIPRGTSLTVEAGGTLIFSLAVDAQFADSPMPASPGAVAVVPEPGTLAFLAAGALVAAVGAWRRRRHACQRLTSG